MIGIRFGACVPTATTIRRFGAEEKIGVNREAFQAMAGQAAKNAGKTDDEIRTIVEKAGEKFDQMAQDQAPIITNASRHDVSPKIIRKIAGK